METSAARPYRRICSRTGLSHRGSGKGSRRRRGNRSGPAGSGDQDLRRHRTGVRARMGRRGAHRMVRAQHQSPQPVSWFVFFPRRDFHRPRFSIGDGTVSRPLRHLPAMPGPVPDERPQRRLPARAAPVHLLPHDRASGSDPDRTAPQAGQLDLRLRYLPGGLPVERRRRLVRRASTTIWPPTSRR